REVGGSTPPVGSSPDRHAGSRCVLGVLHGGTKLRGRSGLGRCRAQGGAYAAAPTLDRPTHVGGGSTPRPSTWSPAHTVHFGGGQFGTADGSLALAGVSLLRSDERVEHDLPDLLCAAAGDGELGSPVQCLLA